MDCKPMDLVASTIALIFHFYLSIKGIFIVLLVSMRIITVCLVSS